jgi:hypothetical protein
MVGLSAVVTTFCTFLIGTWSDRLGKRKPFVSIGYIFWGVFTIVFGVGEFLPKSPITLVATFVVLADAVMSFFGSFGYDAGFSIWTTDISNEHNRGRLGGALAVMPVIATIFGSVVSGLIIDRARILRFLHPHGRTGHRDRLRFALRHEGRAGPQAAQRRKELLAAACQGVQLAHGQAKPRALLGVCRDAGLLHRL